MLVRENWWAGMRKENEEKDWVIPEWGEVCLRWGRETETLDELVLKKKKKEKLRGSGDERKKNKVKDWLISEWR